MRTVQKEETKVDIARRYRDDHGPEMPNLKLARIMYRQNNLRFTNVEDARCCLRKIEGKAGKKSADRTKITHPAPNRLLNPYKLPESDETEFKPFKLNYNKIAILSDIHIPYHSIQAITAAFDFLKKEKPDCILLNGDTIDFHGLSRFVKDPKKRNFAEEINAFKDFFQSLDKHFPYAKKVFKLGNHEERYDHFLWMKASELAGVEEFELENIIKARANGIEVIKEKRIIKAGGLNIIHGHEFNSGFFSPVNIARGLYLRGKTSAIQGHQHRTSEHTEKDMNEKMTTTWSTGCLCELNPAYAPINNWNHGFAIVYRDGQLFDVANKRIFKGKVL
jgi:predicted phosphodiesterase